MDWSLASAQQLARALLAGAPNRLSHVAAVAARTESATRKLGLPLEVVAAAWLHDVGYAPTVVNTGFHPLDGARYLQSRQAPEAIVSLVAYHSGAEFEAVERNLLSELTAIPRPDPLSLDVLTYADMTTSATGHSVSFEDRLSDIFARYSADHPVYRAILRSKEVLTGTVQRVAMVDAASQ